MTLFSSIQQSANALQLSQMGLQVVGNNVANINTPGYIRQELVQATVPGYNQGGLIVGQGAQAISVRQQYDQFLLQRLQSTQSQLSYRETLTAGLGELEAAMNELTDQDISSSLSRFAGSLQDIANHPQNDSLRTLAVQRGSELASAIRDVRQQSDKLVQQATDSISSTVNEINSLTGDIARLNQRIVEVEGGRTVNSDAVGLREERIRKLDELSSLVEFEAIEQNNGTVTVFVGGDYLLTESRPRQLKVVLTDDPAQPTEVRIADTDAPLEIQGGKLRGYYEQRSVAAAQFTSQLDAFAGALITTVNRLHSQGQPSIALQSAAGDRVFTATDVPLELAGSGIEIDNGSFEIVVKDRSSGDSQRVRIAVRQLGRDDDHTVEDILASVNAVSGISASLTGDGRMRIDSNSSGIEFYFDNDTSGFLAAAGINTFFSGSSSQNIDVRGELKTDSRLLAISRDGPGVGAGGALAIAQAFTQPQERLQGMNLQQSYEQMAVRMSQELGSQQTTTTSLANFRNTLEARHLGISGVSLDEEATKLLMYQRAFQASSRVISVANEMLEVLVTMV